MMDIKTKISNWHASIKTWYASTKTLLSSLKVVTPILIILVLIAGTYALFYPGKITQTEIKESHENFPTELVKDANTKIIEVNIFELISNGTITPKEIKLKPGHVLIGVIEGSASIRENSGPFRPALPMSILNFEFTSKGTAQMSDLSQIVVENDLLTISFKPGLENEKIYTSIRKGDENIMGAVKIGIHYSPKPLQYGKAPEGFIKKGEAKRGPTAYAEFNGDEYLQRTKAFLNVGKRLEDGLRESTDVVNNIPPNAPSTALLEFCQKLEKMEKESFNGFIEWGARLYRQFFYGYQGNKKVTGEVRDYTETPPIILPPDSNSSNLSGQRDGDTVIQPQPLNY